MTIIVLLYILFLVLNILDCITTTKALQYGCVERNKLIVWLMNKFGSNWIYIKLAFIIVFTGSGICILVYTSRIVTAVIVLIICNLFYFYVIINNIVMINHRKR